MEIKPIQIDRLTLVLSGDQVLTVINALQEIPFKFANPILLSIEAQIKGQYPLDPPPPMPPMPAPDLTDMPATRAPQSMPPEVVTVNQAAAADRST